MTGFYALFFILIFILAPIAFFESGRIIEKGGYKFLFFDPLCENIRHLIKLAKNKENKTLQKEARNNLILHLINAIILFGAICFLLTSQSFN